MLGRIVIAWSGIGLLCAWTASGAWAIPVGNFSFETPALAPAATPDPLPPLDWSSGAGPGGGAGIYAPGSLLFPEQTGDHLGFIAVDQQQTFGALFQDTVRIEEGTYDWTIGVGLQPGAEPVETQLLMLFEATGGGLKTTLHAETFPPTTFTSTGLTDVTASVTVPAGGVAIDHFLRLVLVTGNGAAPEASRVAYNFDNAVLNFTPPGGSATPAPVGKPSFEPFPFAPWVANGSEGGRAGIFRPNAPLFPNQVGDQLGYVTMRSDPTHAVLFQDATTIQAGTYTMTVGVGDDANFPASQMPLLVFFESIGQDGSKVNLGPTVSVLPEDVNSTTLTDFSVSATVPSGSTDIGRSLRLVLVAVAGDPGSGGDDPRATYFLDNVRLNFVPEGGFLADFDNDTDVDGGDLDQWKGDFGVNGDSDADGDGDSDGADFLVWQRELGSTVPAAAGAGAVPEPGTACIAWILGVTLLGYRRRLAPRHD